MTDDELLEQLRFAVSKQRGYAGFYHWHDKRLKEAGILESFVKGARRLGIELTATRLEDEGKDPPDGWTRLGERQIALELTELVDASLIREEKTTGVPQWRGWTQKEFTEKLTALILKKDHSGFGKHADAWLVIHCDEPGLTFSSVASYCASGGMIKTVGIRRCFVLLSYDPQIASYPVVEVSICTGSMGTRATSPGS